MQTYQMKTGNQTIYLLIRVFVNEIVCVISDSEEVNDNNIQTPHKVIADASEFQSERIRPFEDGICPFVFQEPKNDR